MKAVTLSGKECLLLGLLMLLCLAGGCAARSGVTDAQVQSSPPLSGRPLAAGSQVWIEVKNTSEYEGNIEDFRELLLALLQSDAGLRLAENATSADCVLRVHILQAGLASTETVGLNMREGFGSALSGALLGLAVGSGVGGRSGAAWGAGTGALVGVGIGYARNSDNTADTWTMLADVSVSYGKKSSSNTDGLQTRMAATVQGANLTRESALPSLEDALAQEIVKHFTRESS